MKRTVALSDTRDFGPKGHHMPHSPRGIFMGVVVLPLVDEKWNPVKDHWVLPGCKVRTTAELTEFARIRGLPPFSVVH